MTGRWKVNIAESYVGALSPTGGSGGAPELEGPIPLAEFVEPDGGLDKLQAAKTKLVDFTCIDLASEDVDLSGLPESADILLRLPDTYALSFYGRGRLNVSRNSVAIVMSEPFPNEHRPLIRDGVRDVMIRANGSYGPNPMILLENAFFTTSPAQGTASIEMFNRALAKAEADIASRMGVPLSAVSSEFDAPETITLTRYRLTSALREAAAQGMDRTSGPWSGYAASCREVADRIVKEIETGRFSSDHYHYLDSDRRAS